MLSNAHTLTLSSPMHCPNATIPCAHTNCTTRGRVASPCTLPIVTELCCTRLVLISSARTPDSMECPSIDSPSMCNNAHGRLVKTGTRASHQASRKRVLGLVLLAEEVPMSSGLGTLPEVLPKLPTGELSSRLQRVLSAGAAVPCAPPLSAPLVRRTREHQTLIFTQERHGQNAVVRNKRSTVLGQCM